MYKNKPCVRCGHCCIEYSCGLGVQEPCEHLIPDGNGSQFKCRHYPFDHLDAFTMLCLDPGGGCSYDGDTDAYRNVINQREEVE